MAVAVAFGFSGCATVPMGDAKQDAALKTFQIAPNRAGIYVYRNESMGAAIRMDVIIDGVNIGETAAKTYLYKEVAPGRHVVTSKSENTDTVEVDVKPGTLAYLWQEVKMGLLYAGTKLHIVSEQEGRKGVLETKLAVGKDPEPGDAKDARLRELKAQYDAGRIGQAEYLQKQRQVLDGK